MTSGGVVIPGAPVQQGSKIARVFTPKGGGRPRASVVDDNKAPLKAWRATAIRAIAEAYPHKGPGPMIDRARPVAVQVRFVFPLRVEDRARIGRWQEHPTHLCRPGCVVHLPWHVVTPDKDKCLRAVFDVLKLAGVWHDDAQCCRSEFLAYRGEDPCTMIRWAEM